MVVAFGVLALFFSPAPTGAQSRDMEIMEAFQNTLRRISRDVLPVVVEIEVVERVSSSSRGGTSPLDFFFGRPGTDRRGDTSETSEEYQRHGIGSGIIVRRDGRNVYVLTNEHVAGGADDINLRLHDGREYEARLVGADRNTDLALIVFESDDEIPIATLGDSSDLQVGDFVLAVGNPMGFESTITSGIISALGRKGPRHPDTLPLTDYIQTDAAINEGNSGGALVNLRGEVVGMNTWIASQSGGNVGLGFAIPINNATRAIDQFIESGRIEYGWLGVNMADPPKSPTNSLRESEGGAFVFNVYRQSPASEAGIQPGDIIIRVGDTPIRGGDDLLRAVTSLSPGDRTRFFVKRNGDTRSVYVRTGARPDRADQVRSSDLWPGMSVVEVTDQIRANLDLPSRGSDLIVGHVSDGSPAAIAGLRSGDIVVRVNNRDVGTLRDFYMELNGVSGDEVTFRIRRNDTNLIIGLVK